MNDRYNTRLAWSFQVIAPADRYGRSQVEGMAHAIIARDFPGRAAHIGARLIRFNYGDAWLVEVTVQPATAQTTSHPEAVKKLTD